MSRRRSEPFVPPEEVDGYRGPASILIGEQVVPVDVHLAHHFEPLDGRTHWYGRIERNAVVAELKQSGTTLVELAIGEVAADARLAEWDAWGNISVAGLGTPPYVG